MKLINYLLKTFATFLLLSMAMTGVTQAKDVTMAEFVRLDFNQRVAVCAKIVASYEIGDCASISAPQGEAITTSDLQAMAGSCFEGEVSDSQTLGRCVRAKFDEHNVPANFPSEAHIVRAYNICAQQVSSQDLGSCTASLCTRLPEE